MYNRIHWCLNDDVDPCKDADFEDFHDDEGPYKDGGNLRIKIDIVLGNLWDDMDTDI